MEKGKCYDHALVALFEPRWEGCEELHLCHGFPRLQRPDAGHPAGTSYGHAWIEVTRPCGWSVADTEKLKAHFADFDPNPL